MKILVTGGAGYLGSILLPKLLVRGHKVRVIDIGYFGVGHLRLMRPSVELIREDLRRVLSDGDFLNQLLDGCDAVIHLAAISNDPSAELDPELTDEINYRTTCVLAEAAKKRNVRFFFSSSCSVYGEAPGEVDETCVPNPLTTYAVSKVKAEQALEAMADASWSAVTLRNGTLFGYSPRMRFDLVVNIFSLYSTLYNEVKIFDGGKQWRPFLHVSDCARAFVHFLEQGGTLYRCYNIAHENLTVVDLADIFQTMNPALKIAFLELSSPDLRDYRVSTARMRQEGFSTQVGVASGAGEMAESIISGLIQDPESIYYRNAKWLKELTQLGSKNHKDVMSFMETLASMRSTPGS